MSQQEYYQFINAEHDPFAKLGASAWAALATAVLETLICIKHGHGLFPAPWPTHVVVFWGVVGAVFAVWMLVWSIQFYVLGRPSTKARSKNA